jgi:hypothetical protein
MRGAGSYPVRFAWSEAPLGSPDTFGQKQREPAALGYLWGELADVSAGEVADRGTVEQRTRATIRVRGLVPGLAPRHLLAEPTGEAWTVESVHLDRAAHETVCEVTR